VPANKTTILTADDDPQNLRLLTRNLQLDGYDVIAVTDGQAALAWLGRLWPLAVIGMGLALLYQLVRLQRTDSDDQSCVTPPPSVPTTAADLTESEEQGSDAHEPAAVS
jgi:CheY-like chemotaxis protein